MIPSVMFETHSRNIYILSCARIIVYVFTEHKHPHDVNPVVLGPEIVGGY